jgi:hypothetical protein
VAISVKKDVSRSARRSILVGRYAFHFSGFGRNPRDERDTISDPYYVVGAGHVIFRRTGKLSGRQRSTSMQISGPGENPGAHPGATLRHSIYSLNGKYHLRDDGTGSATISFRLLKQGATFFDDRRPQMTDTLEFVLADSKGDRLWFLSTKPRLTWNNRLTDELMSVEAIRINK